MNKKPNNWQKRSIEQLEGTYYGQPELGDSFLVSSCKKYVKLPVFELTVEQMRMLIGQGVALQYLIPLALDVLKDDILADGGFYPGDLLTSVANINESFWNENLDLSNEFKQLLEINAKLIEREGLKILLD